MAAATFIAKATAAASNSSPHSQAYMGSIQPGDFLILFVFTSQAVGGSPGSIPTPSGWTFINGGIGYRDAAPANIGSMACFYKIATGSESGSQSVIVTGTIHPSDQIYTQMYQYRNAPSPKLESSNMNITGDGASTITCPAVSVGGPERTLIQITGQNGSGPGTPSGYTSRATDSTGGVVAFIHLDDNQNVSSDGATSASGGNTNGWATVHFSIFSAKGRSFFVNQ